MGAKDWLEQNGIDPDSVSDTLIGLLEACDDPKCAAMLRLGLMLTEPVDGTE
jgi:hypothetical protein